MRFLEPGVTSPAMVGDNIQNNTHIQSLDGFAQRNKGFITTQSWVHIAEIGHIVAMVGIGSKNWVQVQRVDTQLLKVRQIILNPFEIAA